MRKSRSRLEPVMSLLSGLKWRWTRRGAAVVMATLVLLFCLSSAAPASAMTPGCQGVEPSPRMCAQPGLSGAFDHLVAVEGLLPAQWVPVFVVSSAPAPIAKFVTQFHAGPSAPRSPPFSVI